MAGNWNFLSPLAARVAAGDHGAEAAFRAQLRPSLACIVRRALSSAADVSPLALRVRALAGELALAPGRPSGEGREDFLGRVARDLCEELIQGLRKGRQAHALPGETVRG